MKPMGWGPAVARLVRPATRPTDGELLGRYVRHRDEAAFRALVDRHGGLVWGVAVRRAADRHAAEDAFQAVFLALARRAGRLSGDACVAGWLHTVAARAAARTRRRQPTSLSADPVASSPDPLDSLSAREVLAVIDDEIARLPDRYRLPLLLCGLDGLSRDEAAARLGWPAGSVKGRLERGRELLRKRLDRRGLGTGLGLLAGGQTIPAGLAASVLDAVRGPTAAVAALATAAGGASFKWPTLVVIVLAIGLGVGMAARPGTVPQAPATARPGTEPQAPLVTAPMALVVKPAAAGAIRGTVTDADGNPVAGVEVLAATDVGKGDRLTIVTDAEGRFAFDRLPAPKTAFPSVQLLAVKNGFAPARALVSATDPPKEVTLMLPASGSYAGTVKDAAGQPVGGATVEVGFVHRSGNGASWGYLAPGLVRSTPAERFYFTATDAAGKFTLTGVPAGGELLLRVQARGFAELDTGAGGPKKEAHVVRPGAPPAELVLQPEAVLSGRVMSRVAVVPASAATVHIEGYQKDQKTSLHGFHRTVTPDADGRFTVVGLPAGPLVVYLDLPTGVVATSVGKELLTAGGQTATADLEVIPGIEVTGLVRLESGEPVAGVHMATIGLVNPHGFHFPVSKTGADGRFTLRLPPGKGTVMVWSVPAGYGQAQGRRQELTIPAGVAGFAIPEPYVLVKVVSGLEGRVVDAAGKVVPHVKVSALQHTSVCGNFETEPVQASGDGRFKLPYSPNGPLAPGTSVPLKIVTDTGKAFEVNALVPFGGDVAEVRLPTAGGLDGPQDVKPSELAGLVVDAAGKQLSGVKAHVWDWHNQPENVSVTGADGVFRIKDNDPKQAVQVRYSKPGYSPVVVYQQPVGVKGLVVVLDQATYFEGRVWGPDGKPAGGAVVRADAGMKRLAGGSAAYNVTETTADADGFYKLMIAPDGYEFQVKAAGVGVARLPKQAIDHGQHHKLDITLEPGITFRATVVDSVTGKPVAGLRLYNWNRKDINVTSAADGTLTVTEMMPGEFSFNVQSERYTRWWCEDAKNPWERKSIDDPERGWQRNFDNLTFELKSGMGTVTITAEPGVRVTGKVLDPDGRPVGGATVAPARTGTGNSLTGDTRFSVETKPDGTFMATLPASGAAEYNLVAHDGKYAQWRTWANGVLPPIKTTPGQTIENVVLTLTRPATVRGRVVDKAGNPVAGREVRAHAADKRENRYYDPTVTTSADGDFELKFIRPAGQLIQVHPFWMDAEQAPPGTSKVLTLKPGEVVEGVLLTAEDEKPQ